MNDPTQQEANIPDTFTPDEVAAALTPFEFHDNQPTAAEVEEMARLDAMKRKRYRMPHEL